MANTGSNAADATASRAPARPPEVSCRWWVRHRAALCAGLALVVAIGIAASQFPASGNDDSHITYFAARQLARIGKLVNYNGERVEQSSSLALVVVLAAIERVTRIEPPSAAYLVSIAAALISIWLCAVVARSARISVLAALLLATFLPFVYWATSGMEGTLAALLGLLSVRASSRYLAGAQGPKLPWPAALAMLGFSLARPEAPAVLLCMLATLTLGVLWEAWPARLRELRTRRALVLSGFALLATLLPALLRRLVYGSWVPRPAAVKTAGFALEHGFRYLSTSAQTASVWLFGAATAGALLVLLRAYRKRAASAELLSFGWAVSYLAFTLASGGDWMPAGRLLVPAAPAFALLAARAVSTLDRYRRPFGLALAVAVAGLGAKAALVFGASHQNGSYTWADAFDRADVLVGPAQPHFAFSELGNRAHRRDARLLSVLLDAVAKLHPTPERPLFVMSGQAGMVPYYLLREFPNAIHFLDLYALTSAELANCLPASAQKPGIHGIALSSSYLLDHMDELGPRCHLKRPDVVFSTGRFPRYLSDFKYRKLYQGPRSMEAFIGMASER